MTPRAALASCLLASAAALRSRHAHDAPYKQTLGNMADLQYFGEMSVGGQSIKAILDTGSFELVVFSKQCPTCGMAAAYSEKASKTFKWGAATQVHAYGSGSCTAKDGFDTASIGKVTAEEQPLWLAVDCQMPLLARASFNAIAGIGPPGQPEYTAESEVKYLEDLETRYKEQGAEIPKAVLEQKDEAEKALAAARGKKSMLEAFGVSTFSTCLGREPGSPGYLIWNDQTRAGTSGVKRIPVAGNITWGVALKGMGFRVGQHDVGVACSGGCGAIVDTGTSLFAVPTPIYQSVASQIEGLGVRLDCSDLSAFPDLVMDVGGQRLEFPPSSYLGSYAGQMRKDLEGFVRTDRLGGSHGSRTPCQLLLMDLGPVEQTTLGPMLILGMPFFREYYTTFDLGKGRGDRSIFVSPASDSCAPAVDGSVQGDRLRRALLRNRPRTVDLSTVRVPQWFRPRGHPRV